MDSAIFSISEENVGIRWLDNFEVFSMRKNVLLTSVLASLLLLGACGGGGSGAGYGNQMGTSVGYLDYNVEPHPTLLHATKHYDDDGQ